MSNTNTATTGKQGSFLSSLNNEDKINYYIIFKYHIRYIHAICGEKKIHAAWKICLKRTNEN